MRLSRRAVLTGGVSFVAAATGLPTSANTLEVPFVSRSDLFEIFGRQGELNQNLSVCNELIRDTCHGLYGGAPSQQYVTDLEDQLKSISDTLELYREKGVDVDSVRKQWIASKQSKGPTQTPA